MTRHAGSMMNGSRSGVSTGGRTRGRFVGPRGIGCGAGCGNQSGSIGTMIGITRRRISRTAGATTGTTSGSVGRKTFPPARIVGSCQSSGRRDDGPQINGAFSGPTTRTQSSQTSRGEEPRFPRGIGSSIAGHQKRGSPIGATGPAVGPLGPTGCGPQYSNQSRSWASADAMHSP
jgi:hypothetical protein